MFKKNKNRITIPETSSYKGIPVTPRGANRLAVFHGYKDLAEFTHKLPEGARVLDVGAGLSPFGRVVASARPDIDWVNLDPSYTGKIKKEARRGAPPNLHLVRGDVASIDERYAPGTFDVVLSSWMMPHLLADREGARRAAADMFEVAKFGGRVSIGPTYDAWQSWNDPIGVERIHSVSTIKTSAETPSGFADHVVANALPPERAVRVVHSE